MGKKGCRRVFSLVCLLAIGGGVGGYAWAKRELEPMPEGKSFYVRYAGGKSLIAVFGDLKKRNVVRNPEVLRLYGRLTSKPVMVKEATYRFNPGMTADQVYASFGKPVSQSVRIPETNLSYRTANLLEKANVCTATSYEAIIADPSLASKLTDLPLPKKGNLEGYLYPDTYDLPPLLGAQGVVRRQLQAFEQKIWPLVKERKDVNRVLTIASMVELEAGVDEDRAMIAGVIENRLKLGMPLQIDATLLYAIREWRRLTFADYRNINSPYSTYKNKGLPPGPICSPSLKSVEAALNPASHSFLFYVAKPDKTHAFSVTYSEHLANIAKIRAANR